MSDDQDFISNPKAFRNVKTGRVMPYSETLHKFYKQGKLNLQGLAELPDELKKKAKSDTPAKKPAANRRAAVDSAKSE